MCAVKSDLHNLTSEMFPLWNLQPASDSSVLTVESVFYGDQLEGAKPEPRGGIGALTGGTGMGTGFRLGALMETRTLHFTSKWRSRK